MRLLAAFLLTACVAIPNARAEGETSPMLGGAIIAGASTEPSASVAGLELEAAVWWHFLGASFAASARTPVDHEASRMVVLGGSLRVLAMQRLVASLFEPSDVELAVELQGIAERTVWSGALTDREPYRHGLGIALRFRGTTEDHTPRLIAESRFFVRVLSWRQPDDELVARTSMPAAEGHRELIVLLGIGAAFGGGEPRYLQQFGRRPFESGLLPP